MSENQNKPHDPKTCPECRRRVAQSIAQADQIKCHLKEQERLLTEAAFAMGTDVLNCTLAELIHTANELKASLPDQIEDADAQAAAVIAMLKADVAVYGLYMLFVQSADKAEAAMCGEQEP